jgi:hypothetical protein
VEDLCISVPCGGQHGPELDGEVGGAGRGIFLRSLQDRVLSHIERGLERSSGGRRGRPVDRSMD